MMQDVPSHLREPLAGELARTFREIAATANDSAVWTQAIGDLTEGYVSDDVSARICGVISSLLNLRDSMARLAMELDAADNISHS